MKRLLFLIILTVILSGSLSCFHYKHVTFSIYFTGGAYNTDNNKVVFARYCHIYQCPKGIARFPDGGRVKTRYKTIFLYLFDIKTASIKKLTEIKKFSGGIPPHIKLIWSGENIIFQMRGGNSVLRIINEKGNEKKIVSEAEKNKLAKSLKECSQDMIPIKKIEKLVEHIKLDEWGAPAPLEYNHKKLKVYISDLIKGRGDKFYRQAIIEKYISNLSYEDRQKIAIKMLRHLKKIEGVGSRLSYESYLYRWEHMLEKVLPETKGKVKINKKVSD